MSGSRPTLDQRRARHAWEAVERARRRHNVEDAKAYARETRRLPVRIKTSGLGQAVAFLNAKAGEGGKDPRATLLNDLGDWLLAQRGLAPVPEGGIGRDSVMRMILNGDAGLLRRATDEALSYLQWLMRFSAAEIGTED